MALAKNRRRTRVERGVYRQPNGNYAVCARHAGRLHFRTVGRDLAAALRVREELVTALAGGRVPASPRLRFDTVAGWWLERFEAKVAPASGGRAPGRPEIERLLDACPPRGRLLVTTALYSGLRISELLGLIWEDIDFAAGLIRVRAQLSRAHHDEPARRVAPKTPASVRDVPLVEQLSHQLAAHKQASPFAAPGDWVFATSRGTPYGHRNAARRVLTRAADTAQLNGDGWPPPPCSTSIPAKPPSRCSPTR
jgi:integrase